MTLIDLIGGSVFPTERETLNASDVCIQLVCVKNIVTSAYVWVSVGMFVCTRRVYGCVLYLVIFYMLYVYL